MYNTCKKKQWTIDHIHTDGCYLKGDELPRKICISIGMRLFFLYNMRTVKQSILIKKIVRAQCNKLLYLQNLTGILQHLFTIFLTFYDTDANTVCEIC